MGQNILFHIEVNDGHETLILNQVKIEISIEVNLQLPDRVLNEGFALLGGWVWSLIEHIFQFWTYEMQVFASYIDVIVEFFDFRHDVVGLK